MIGPSSEVGMIASLHDSTIAAASGPMASAAIGAIALAAGRTRVI